MKMNMKKIALVLPALLSLAIALPVSAATIDASRSQVAAQVGNVITVQYTIDPAGEREYSAKLALNFPPGVLTLTSFQFGDGWIALSQPGYDRVDNVNGVLVKTAGYPKGTAVPTIFGTAQFKVVGNGTGTVTLAGDSFVHNAARANALVMASPVTTTVTASRPAAKPAAATPAPVPAPVPTPAPAIPSPQPSQNLFDVQPVGISTSTPESSGWSTWSVIGVVVVLIVIVAVAMRWTKKAP
jgi:hypothetical protein